jgi:hypothetical protein
MNTRLLILAINIIAASIILLVYGFTVNDTGLIGLSYSTLILGSVIAVLSYTYSEPILEPLLMFTRGLLNGVTTILEDLDLTDAKPSIIKAHDGSYFLLYARTVSNKIDPGIGVIHETPYLAIPLETRREIPVLEEISRDSLETVLSSILVEQSHLCKSITVDITGNYVKTTIIGANKRIKEITGHPVEPMIIIIGLILAQAMNATRVSLVEKGTIPDGEYYVYMVGASAE